MVDVAFVSSIYILTLISKNCAIQDKVSPCFTLSKKTAQAETTKNRNVILLFLPRRATQGKFREKQRDISLLTADGS